MSSLRFGCVVFPLTNDIMFRQNQRIQVARPVDFSAVKVTSDIFDDMETDAGYQRR
jgi:hypothetical protein